MDYDISENEEFSRIYSVDKIPPLGRNVKLAASDAECAALADRFGVLSCDFLKLQLKLMVKSKGQVATAKGRMRARVVQSCVATLDPVIQDIDEELNLLFEDEEALQENNNILDVDVDISNEDIADPIINGHFDVGAAVSEHLAMALDPYPRREDVELNLPNDENAAEPVPSAANNPFAVLGVLKDPKGTITGGNES